MNACFLVVRVAILVAVIRAISQDTRALMMGIAIWTNPTAGFVDAGSVTRELAV